MKETWKEKEYNRLMNTELKQAISEDFFSAPAKPSDSMDSDAFWAWLEEGRQRENEIHRVNHVQRQHSRRTMTAIAAVFACVIIAAGTILSAGLFQPEETEAGRQPDSSVTEEHGTIVIGGDGNESETVWTATVDSFDKIPEEYRQYLVMPEGLPEGYELLNIQVHVETKFSEANFIFQDKNERIQICEIYHFDEIPLSVLYGFEQISINEKTAYCKKIEGRVQYAVFQEDLLIQLNVSNRLSQLEINQMLSIFQN